MSCERAEQPLSCSALEDTGVSAPMGFMMVGSSNDICLFVCSLQSPGTCGGHGAAPSREGEPELQGHTVAPELPQAESPSRGDTGRSQSYPQSEGGSRYLGLKLMLRVPDPQGIVRFYLAQPDVVCIRKPK
jgi:hypothetical protein